MEQYVGAAPADHATIVEAVDGAAVAVDLATWLMQVGCGLLMTQFLVALACLAAAARWDGCREVLTMCLPFLVCALLEAMHAHPTPMPGGPAAGAAAALLQGGAVHEGGL